MPWRCPACSALIVHSGPEPAPKSGVRYRCPTCHVELVLNADTNGLRVAPLDDDRPQDGRTA